MVTSVTHKMERRRSPKRESRITILRLQHFEEDYLLDEADLQLGTAKNHKQ
jgi:hypothetical protein